MAMKTTFFLLLLGIPGILEVQAASIAGENEIWKNLDEGLPCFLFFFEVFRNSRVSLGFSYIALNLD